MLEPEVESRRWSEQFELDDASYRAQLSYLFERSAFYREKLIAAGIGSAEEAGGLADIARLPLTDKQELRAAVAPRNPIGTHLCVAAAEIVRIYSTSGTTGAPTYVPLTATDLENWLTGSARSYAASGVTRRATGRDHVRRRPVRRRRGAGRVRPHRPQPHSLRHRQYRAPHAGNRAAPAGGGRADTVVRRVPRRDVRPPRVERRARSRRGGAGRRRACLPSKARGGLGRTGDRGDGHRRHRRLALG